MTFPTDAKKLYYDWLARSVIHGDQWLNTTRSIAAWAFCIDIMTHFYAMGNGDGATWSDIVNSVFEIIMDGVNVREDATIVLCVDRDAASPPRQLVARTRTAQAAKSAPNPALALSMKEMPTPSINEPIGPLPFRQLFQHRRWRYDVLFPWLVAELQRARVPEKTTIILHGFLPTRTLRLGSGRWTDVLREECPHVRFEAVEGDLSSASWAAHFLGAGYAVTMRAKDGDVLTIGLLLAIRISNPERLTIWHGDGFSYKLSATHVAIRECRRYFGPLVPHAETATSNPVLDFLALLMMAGNDYVQTIKGIGTQCFVEAYVAYFREIIPFVRVKNNYVAVVHPRFESLVRYTCNRKIDAPDSTSLLAAHKAMRKPSVHVPSPEQCGAMAANIEFCLNYFLCDPQPDAAQPVMLPPSCPSFYGYCVHDDGLPAFA